MCRRMCTEELCIKAAALSKTNACISTTEYACLHPLLAGACQQHVPAFPNAIARVQFCKAMSASAGMLIVCCWAKCHGE